MKKKVLFSVLVIIIIAAAFGAGTMAWFTAKAEAPENTFTAGIVMIEAGSSYILSQYFDSTENVFVYGIEAVTGDIYEIDPLNGLENRIFESPLTSAHSNYPNALAFDNVNDRLYFTQNSTSLYFYDFSSNALVFAGTLNYTVPQGFTKNAYGATFGGGYYWFIPNSTADLYRLSFNPDGTIDSVLSVTMTDDYTVSFGDFVIDYVDGVIYGSSSGYQADQIFFSYEITDKNDLSGTFTKISDQTVSNAAVNLQLAYGHDGVLYGHRTRGGADARRWYTVDLDTGTRTQLDFRSARGFEDLASGSTSYWNPGDCAWKKYTVKNTGSKDIRVRLELSGAWEFNWQWLWENWDALCFSEETAKPDAMEGDDWDAFVTDILELPDPVTFEFCDPEQDDWVVGEDGYWYYTGSEYDPIEPGDELELCIKVCLDGEGATNEFQGGRFKLNAKFDAVQASNYAPYYEWDVIDLYEVPNEDE